MNFITVHLICQVICIAAVLSLRPRQTGWVQKTNANKAVQTRSESNKLCSNLWSSSWENNTWDCWKGVTQHHCRFIRLPAWPNLGCNLLQRQGNECWLRCRNRLELEMIFLGATRAQHWCWLEECSDFSGHGYPLSLMSWLWWVSINCVWKVFHGISLTISAYLILWYLICYFEIKVSYLPVHSMVVHDFVYGVEENYGGELWRWI